MYFEHIIDLTIILLRVLFIDINECTEGTHDCSQTCVNTEGSFECTCLTGYMLQGRTLCEGEYFKYFHNQHIHILN